MEGRGADGCFRGGREGVKKSEEKRQRNTVDAQKSESCAELAASHRFAPFLPRWRNTREPHGDPGVSPWAWVEPQSWSDLIGMRCQGLPSSPPAVGRRVATQRALRRVPFVFEGEEKSLYLVSSRRPGRLSVIGLLPSAEPASRFPLAPPIS